MWQKKAQNINAVFVEFFYAQKRLKNSFSRCTFKHQAVRLYHKNILL